MVTEPVDVVAVLVVCVQLLSEYAVNVIVPDELGADLTTQRISFTVTDPPDENAASLFTFSDNPV